MLYREVLAKLNFVYFTVEVDLWVNDVILNRKEEKSQGKKRLPLKISCTTLWINSSGKLNVPQAFFNLPRGMGKRIRSVIVRKVMDWDKDNSIGKAEVICMQSKIRTSLITSHCQAPLQPSPGNRAAAWVVVIWEDKCQHSKHHPSFFFPQLYMLRRIPCGMGHPFSHLGSAFLSPSNILGTPSPFTVGSRGAMRNREDLGKSTGTAQWPLKHLHFNTLFTLFCSK